MDLARRRQEQRRASQAAAAATQRAQAQARYYQQQQRSAREAAQERRVAGEQAARIAEQRRRSAIETRTASAEARSQDATRRRITHTVGAKDSAESIGARYGLPPKDVAGMVPRLRPGQRLTLEVPQAIQREDRPTREVPQPEGGAGPILPGVSAAGPVMAQQFIQGAVGAMPTVARAIARFGEATAWWDEQLGISTPARQDFAQQLQALGPQATELEESREFKLATGQEIPRADLSQFNEQRQIPGGIHDQMEAAIDEAKGEWGQFGATMRYTGQALATAHEAMLAGDPDWQRYLSDSEGNVNMFLTDGRWDTGPMKEQFSPEMWENIQELGFFEVEDGLWMIPSIEEEGYGMGDYAFPGYGGGYGFGGGAGEYEYLSRGGVLRRKAGGGVSTGERYRIFPEGTSPAHWRI